MVGKKRLFELKKCTVSGLKRQFDKWHLFSAPTGGGGWETPRQYNFESAKMLLSRNFVVTVQAPNNLRQDS